MASKDSIRKRLFREFLPQDTKYIGKNYLRYLKKIRRNINKNYDISFSDMEFLMWGYSLPHLKHMKIIYLEMKPNITIELGTL